MQQRNELDLEDHAENTLPALFHWSAAYGGHDPSARVILYASIDPRLHSARHMRVTPPATLVSFMLTDDALLSLAETVDEALKVRKLARRNAPN